ncbi:MAG: hypothetical protein GY856_51800, partial [bacterium]|nr:hypothetical protein [bacterium]
LLHFDDSYAYFPPLGFFGEDPFTYFLFGEGATTDSATVRVLVSPARAPLTGFWNGLGAHQAGWLESSTAEIFLCPALDLEADCSLLQLPPETAGWTPLSGDWDGDGLDELGIYDPLSGWFHHVFVDAGGLGQLDPILAGRPAQAAFAGDWDGDGRDSLGLYSPSTTGFTLYGEDQASGIREEFVWGPDQPELFDLRPLSGDWDGDGDDTVGLHIVGLGLYLTNQVGESSVEDPIIDEYQPFDGVEEIIARSGSDWLVLYDRTDHVVYIRSSIIDGAIIPPDFPPDPGPDPP